MQTWTIWDAELSHSPASIKVPAAAAETGGPPAEPVHVGDGGNPMWGVYQVRPDGRNWIHVFPHSTLEWRCAEYGIDHEDTATLLDVILHEPFIPDPNDPLVWADPTAEEVLKVIHGLPTVATPRVSDTDRLQAHLARVAAVKEHRVRLAPARRADRQAALVYIGSERRAPTDPLDPIRTLTRLDPVRVAGRRMAVEWQRAQMAGPVRPTFDLKPPGSFPGMLGFATPPGA
ncbi:hypothetical protein [Herbidospora mongoliensis]|uniref:hypothetical protein n=1 Tax=Herbidospora mongoliensis TaxID=688067 RepID=UPI000B012CC5|nr:hypothetical protein [Herbidospora mongoliensis]